MATSNSRKKTIFCLLLLTLFCSEINARYHDMKESEELGQMRGLGNKFKAVDEPGVVEEYPENLESSESTESSKESLESDEAYDSSDSDEKDLAEFAKDSSEEDESDIESSSKEYSKEESDEDSDEEEFDENSDEEEPADEEFDEDDLSPIMQKKILKKIFAMNNLINEDSSSEESSGGQQSSESSEESSSEELTSDELSNEESNEKSDEDTSYMERETRNPEEVGLKKSDFDNQYGDESNEKIYYGEDGRGDFEDEEFQEMTSYLISLLQQEVAENRRKLKENEEDLGELYNLVLDMMNFQIMDQKEGKYDTSESVEKEEEDEEMQLEKILAQLEQEYGPLGDSHESHREEYPSTNTKSSLEGQLRSLV